MVGMNREFILDKILGERGFSVADLTRMANLGRSTVDDIRRKGGGRRENIEKIAAALGLEYEDLYSNDGTSLFNGYAKKEKRIFNGTDLLEAADIYAKKDTRSENGEHIGILTQTVADILGEDVIRYFDEADAKYEEELFNEALEIYIKAMISLKQRFSQRLLASLPNILSICEQINRIHPVNALFKLVKDYRPTDETFEILCRMAAFYLSNGTSDPMIIESLKKAIEHEGTLNKSI
jgi:lambda repressor-like predicted transcriptional regulator